MDIEKQRQRELNRVNRGTGRLADSFVSRAVGMSFAPHYPHNLHDLAARVEEHEHHEENVAAIIVRNPDNVHDANACEVHVPALGERAMIGHLPTAVAARLAPLIDVGETWQGEIESVLISRDAPDRPGITVRLHRVEG